MDVVKNLFHSNPITKVCTDSISTPALIAIGCVAYGALTLFQRYMERTSVEVITFKKFDPERNREALAAIASPRQVAVLQRGLCYGITMLFLSEMDRNPTHSIRAVAHSLSLIEVVEVQLNQPHIPLADTSPHVQEYDHSAYLPWREETDVIFPPTLEDEKRWHFTFEAHITPHGDHLLGRIHYNQSPTVSHTHAFCKRGGEFAVLDGSKLYLTKSVRQFVRIIRELVIFGRCQLNQPPFYQLIAISLRPKIA